MCKIISRYTVQRTTSYTCVELSTYRQNREPSAARVYNCQQIENTENYQLHVGLVVSRYTEPSVARVYSCQQTDNTMLRVCSIVSIYIEPLATRVYNCQQIHSTEKLQLHVFKIVSR
jgi:hypothetical protein